MCGRYSLYTERENAQLRAILAEIARRYPEKSSQAASGEEGGGSAWRCV